MKNKLTSTFRDRGGRYAKPLEITLYLREIRVVPVKVVAASVEEAEEMAREGDGEYLNDKAYHSDLSAGEYFETLFERDADVKEVN
jgi:hypothetical protein